MEWLAKRGQGDRALHGITQKGESRQAFMMRYSRHFKRLYVASFYLVFHGREERQRG